MHSTRAYLRDRDVAVHRSMSRSSGHEGDRIAGRSAAGLMRKSRTKEAGDEEMETDPSSQRSSLDSDYISSDEDVFSSTPLSSPSASSTSSSSACPSPAFSLNSEGLPQTPCTEHGLGSPLGSPSSSPMRPAAYDMWREDAFERLKDEDFTSSSSKDEIHVPFPSQPPPSFFQTSRTSSVVSPTSPYSPSRASASAPCTPTRPISRSKVSKTLSSSLPSSPLSKRQASESTAPTSSSSSSATDAVKTPLNLSLLFTSSPTAVPSAKSDLDDVAAAPAFFPGQRVSFTPSLRVGPGADAILRAGGMDAYEMMSWKKKEAVSKGNGKGLRVRLPEPDERRRRAMDIDSEESEFDECDWALSGMLLGVTGLATVLDPVSPTSAPSKPAQPQPESTGPGLAEPFSLRPSSSSTSVRTCGSVTERIRSQRVLADFVTDLGEGLKIWSRDAQEVKTARKRSKHQNDWIGKGEEDRDGQVLPPGNYILPMSMRIPESGKLPPSFSCANFRISYTMSLALVISRRSPPAFNLYSRSQPRSSNVDIRVLTVASVPFHILPSTLPSLPPRLPSLSYDERPRNTGIASGVVGGVTGVWESLKKNLSWGTDPVPVQASESSASSSAAKEKEREREREKDERSVQAPQIIVHASHKVIPSMPSSNFSPGSSSVIPISLRIVSKLATRVSSPPCSTTLTSTTSDTCRGPDVYVRLSLVRRIYVRDETRSMAQEADDFFLGVGLGSDGVVSPETEEWLLDRCIKEEREVASRWSWMPWEARKESPLVQGESEWSFEDVGLPLGGESSGGVWNEGYSSAVTLTPSPTPSLEPTLKKPGTQTGVAVSWFSSALTDRLPVAKEYDRHLSVASRFFVRIEVGFAQAGKLKESLVDVLEACPDMEVPPPGVFTPSPQCNDVEFDRHCNPFPSQDKKKSSIQNRGGQQFPSTNPFIQPELPSFPGKLRELLIPVTLGSVAEPNLQSLVSRRNASSNGSSSSSGGRGGGESNQARPLSLDEDGPDEESWLCAPPSYAAALKVAPAYC